MPTMQKQKRLRKDGVLSILKNNSKAELRIRDKDDL
jgi:hypothetical protein